MNDSNNRTKAVWSCLAAVLLALALPAAADTPAPDDTAAPDNGPAIEVVQGFNAAMVDVLEDAASLDYKGRFERLRPALEKTFDLDFMAEKAVGRFWHDLSAEERTQWRATFANFMSANYASRLNKFNNQKFEVTGSQAAANDTVIVQTKVSEPGNEDVELSYRMRQTPAGWRVIDIYYNGTVSELALRRADYAAVLKKDGFAALIGSVGQKIADMEAGKNA